MSNVLAAKLGGHLLAAGVCPKAPPGVQTWSDQVLAWVKWGVLAILAISFFVSVGMLDLGPGHPPPQGRPARLRRPDDLHRRRDHLRRRLRDHQQHHRERLLMFGRRSGGKNGQLRSGPARRCSRC